MTLPGWDSIEAASKYATMFRYLGWFTAFFSVIFQIAAYRYSEREKTLVSERTRKKLEETENRLSPWRLDGNAQERVLSKVKRFGESGVIFEIAAEPEPFPTELAEKIRRIVMAVPWMEVGSRGRPISSLGMAVGIADNPAAGVTIEVPPPGTPTVNSEPPIASDFAGPARVLAEALIAEGIVPTRTIPREAETDPVTALFAVRGAVKIVVGPKQ